MRSFVVFFVIMQNKLLDKQSSCQWIETPWRSRTWLVTARFPLLNFVFLWLSPLHWYIPFMYEECCAKRRYQGHGQVITPHRCVDVITCQCLWYLHLAQHSSYSNMRYSRYIFLCWYVALSFSLYPTIWLYRYVCGFLSAMLSLWVYYLWCHWYLSVAIMTSWQTVESAVI